MHYVVSVLPVQLYATCCSCVLHVAAVYDINKYTMRETDEYDLKFVRYLLSSHVQNICSLTSISGKG